jgi:mannosyltransferase
MLPSYVMTIKNKSHHVTLIAITAVLLLAALLRIYHITQQSIWFDEAFAWNIIIQDDMFPRISTDTHPPLYHLMLRVWVFFSGDSPLALRYLSALASIMTVAFVYRVGREVVFMFTKRAHPRMRPYDVHYAPVLAAFVIALSDAEIFLAQEARNYALYTFFVTLSMWMYLRWLRRPSMISALWWASSVTALVYTHYLGLFIPFIQGLHVLLFLRGRMRINGVGILALSGLPVLPWFIFVTIPQTQNALDNSLPFAIDSNWDTLLHLRGNFLGAQWALMIVLAIAGLFAMTGRFAESPLQKRHKYGAFFIVFMWFAVPFSVLFFGNYFAELLTERKLLIVVPAISLMIGFGLSRMDNLARIFLVAVLLIYGVSTVDYWREKEPWDEIAAESLIYTQPSDLAIAEVQVGQYPMKYYWQRQLPDGANFTTYPYLIDLTMAPTLDWYTYYDAHLPQLFVENQRKRSGDVATVWLVFWGGDEIIFERLAENGYARTMTVVTDHIGNEINLYRYDHLPTAPAASYQNGMNLRAVEIDAETLRVDLWWSTDEQLAENYTTAVMLLDERGLPVAQMDSQPYFEQRPTSSWQPGEVVFDPKTLQLNEGTSELASGEYTVIVKVYLWSPDIGITDIPTTDGDMWMVVGTISR